MMKSLSALILVAGLFSVTNAFAMGRHSLSGQPVTAQNNQDIKALLRDETQLYAYSRHYTSNSVTQKIQAMSLDGKPAWETALTGDAWYEVANGPGYLLLSQNDNLYRIEKSTGKLSTLAEKVAQGKLRWTENLVANEDAAYFTLCSHNNGAFLPSVIMKLDLATSRLDSVATLGIDSCPRVMQVVGNDLVFRSQNAIIGVIHLDTKELYPVVINANYDSVPVLASYGDMIYFNEASANLDGMQISALNLKTLKTNPVANLGDADVTNIVASADQVTWLQARAKRECTAACWADGSKDTVYYMSVRSLKVGAKNPKTLVPEFRDRTSQSIMALAPGGVIVSSDATGPVLVSGKKGN